MSDFAIPTRVSLEDLKDIIKAYYIEGAHSEPVSTDSVEATADMGDKVSRQTNFLSEIEVLSKEGRERALTEDGESIAEALMGGNDSLAQSLMREVLNDWEFTDKIKGFVRMQEPDPVSSDRIMEYISANASSTNTRGRKTLIALLVWAGILEEEDEDKYVLAKSQSEGTGELDDTSPETVDDDVSEDLPATEVSQQKESIERLKQSKPAISINIDISGSDEPSKVKSIIKAARRGLIEDLDENIDD